MNEKLLRELLTFLDKNSPARVVRLERGDDFEINLYISGDNATGWEEMTPDHLTMFYHQGYISSPLWTA